MIPKSLQGVLWSVGLDKLDPKKNKTYIVHQVLAYGTWEHIKWLFRTCSKTEIGRVFTTFPSKDYTRASFNFVKNLVLGIGNKLVEEKNYVRSFPRNIRQE